MKFMGSRAEKKKGKIIFFILRKIPNAQYHLKQQQQCVDRRDERIKKKNQTTTVFIVIVMTM